MRTSQEAITSLVGKDHWRGRDATAFLDTWRSKSAPRLRAASDLLGELATTLRRQAEEQRRASGGGAAGATSGGGAGAEPGAGDASARPAGDAGAGGGEGSGSGGAGGAPDGGAGSDGPGGSPDGGSAATDGGADGGGAGTDDGADTGDTGGDRTGADGTGSDGAGTPFAATAVTGWDSQDPEFGGWTPPPMPEAGWEAVTPDEALEAALAGRGVDDAGAGLAGSEAGSEAGSAAGSEPGSTSGGLGASLGGGPEVGTVGLASAEPAGSSPGEVLSRIGAEAMNPRFLIGGFAAGGAMLAREALKSRDKTGEYLGDEMVERTGMRSLGWRPKVGREHALRLNGLWPNASAPGSASPLGAQLGLEPDRP